MNNRATARIAAILFGLALTFASFALLELTLRLSGVGDAVPVHDPFAGFSATVPTFEPTVDEQGIAIYRVARNRANPRRPEAVLSDPQRRFLAEKPANGFRVFVVGGSSAAGTPYPTSYAFSGWLEQLLVAALPGRSVEVTNAAFSGYATRRVLTVVREIARHEPDLLVVYAGHNEFAEERFYAHLVDLDPRIFRLWEWAASLRSYQLLARLLPVPSPGSDAPPQDLQKDGKRALQMFAVLDERSQGDAYTNQREDSYRDLHYAFNLRQIVGATVQVGGRVALLSLGQNLSDWAPAASQHGRPLDAAMLARFDARIEAGDAAREAADCAAAATAYRAALDIDGSYAQAHFDLATCLRSLGRLEDAAAHYARASDLDRVPHGAPGPFNQTIREVAEETGALFIDTSDALKRESGERLSGDDLFLDMVHPNIRAHQVIAGEIVRALRADGTPEPPRAWQPTPELAPTEALHERDPHLAFLEAQIRAVACQLARRDACAEAAASVMRSLEPDNPFVDRPPRARSRDGPI